MPLTNACTNFMKNNEIQNIFWKVNKHAQNIYQTHDGNIMKITNELLDKFIIDKQTDKPKRHLDFTKLYRDNYLRTKTKANMSRIETFLGVKCRNSAKMEDVTVLKKWNEQKRDELKQYVINCIVSEANNPNYVIYRGGSAAPNIEITYRQPACFSDGLFSGWMLDAGASAFELSGGINKLWKLGMDRKKLLKKEYPIFIPPAFHLLSAAGTGELFHIRTKVVQTVKNTDDTVYEYELSITGLDCIDPIVAGYKINQTPEYFTTNNPEILKTELNLETFNYKYKKTGQGVFDNEGAEKLKNMVNNMKEVNKDGTF